MVRSPRYPAPNRWRDAKCTMVEVKKYYDPFFGEGDDVSEQDALDVCNGGGDDPPCIVREQCLLFALTNNERDGVWGGTSEKDRIALRKRWPLGRGVKEEGHTVWQPREEWRWYPPGEPASWFADDDLKEAEGCDE